MEPVSEEQLDAAIYKRKDYVLQNLHTLTMKQFRDLLEKDLSLPEKALKGLKDIVQTKVDEVVSTAQRSKEGRQAGAPEVKACSSKTVVKRQEEKGREKPQKEEKGREKPRKKQKREDVAAAGPAAVSGPREYSKRVQKMRAVCRRAGITIPPNVYSKHKTDTSLEGALEGLLEKHRLHRKSTQAEIAAAHRRLQKEKDMEGIDISNIVEGGRRARNRVDYSTVLKPKYEDISEDSGSPQEDDEDDDSIDGADASEASNRENVRQAYGSAEKRKQLGKRKQQEESEEEGADSPEGQREGSSGSDGDAGAGRTEAGNSDRKKAAEQHLVKSSGKKKKQAAEQKLVKSPSTKQMGTSEQKGVKSPSKTKTTEQNHVKSPGKDRKRAAEQNGWKSPVAQAPAPSPKKLSAKKTLSTAEKPPNRPVLADWSDDE